VGRCRSDARYRIDGTTPIPVAGGAEHIGYCGPPGAVRVRLKVAKVPFSVMPRSLAIPIQKNQIVHFKKGESRDAMTTFYGRN
jgi:hypothetical protein